MFKKVLQTIAAAMTLCLTMHLAMASEELDEKEKHFDRATSLETLKLIIKLGFKISK